MWMEKKSVTGKGLEVFLRIQYSYFKFIETISSMLQKHGTLPDDAAIL